MNYLNIAIILFVIMETLNVITLYFFPKSRYGNGVGVFNNLEKAEKDESTWIFTKYMINWVANVKLIFIALLLVIYFIGDESIKVWATVIMILSISLYFITLHPLIKKLDNMGEITPKGYSKGLFAMILGMIVMFLGALILHFIF